MAFSVEGKSVIVTGAGKGVGQAIARRFTELGASVMLAGNDEEGLAAEAAAMQKQDLNAAHFAGDLREKLTIANLISATIDAFDRIDILINASRDVQTSEPCNPDDRSLDHLLAQNLLPTLRLSQMAARKMVKAHPDRDPDETIGAIVNVTSIAARRTLPELMAYSVTSAAVDQLTRSMAVALAPDGIRVNGIALGSVMSASLKTALKDSDSLQKDVTAVTPLGRIGEAEEAAEAAVFLASDSASFILAVDGGRTMLDPINKPAH